MISALRQQMIDAMTLRGFSPRTHKSYLSAVTDLAKYYHRSPDRLSIEQIQAYFLYLVKERYLSCAARQGELREGGWGSGVIAAIPGQWLTTKTR